MKHCLLIFTLLLTFKSNAQRFDPVNAKASPEAKKVLSYLYDINGKSILSGQHNYNQSMNVYSDSAKAITGKYPAVWGTDFIWNGTKDNGQAIVDEAIRKNKDGYLITLMWHEGRPTDNAPYGWKESIQGKLTDAEWKELITPNTQLNKRWLTQVDQIAAYLKQLQDAHVPVLWRPYHEMNGIWFWWGNRPGENGVTKLWKMMYNRFVDFHHLNNLLWVWGANGPRDIPKDEAYAYKDFYPGANYVDILGTDIYHFDYEQKDYNELLDLAKGKIIALTEVGELPKPEILQAQPKWAWFMVWSSWLWTDNTKDRVKEVYLRPQTINH
ncbi:MAG: glycosyl hydrolase [Janthinobacterium lividum]